VADDFDQTAVWRAPAAPVRRVLRPPETRTEIVVPRASPAVPYAAGERVFHEKFGYGTVAAVDAGKLDVDFQTGRKKVMDAFVRKA
jgi:hypothetical protein